MTLGYGGLAYDLTLKSPAKGHTVMFQGRNVVRRTEGVKNNIVSGNYVKLLIRIQQKHKSLVRKQGKAKGP